MKRSMLFRASLFAAAVLVLALFPDACAFASWQADGNPICTAVGDQYPPTITSDGAGGAIITWYDYRSGTADIYVQRVNASGVVQWTADGIAICTAAGYQTYPTITSDGAGGAIVAWHDQRSGTWDIYAQRVNASGAVQWTADGVALCTAADIQLYPTIISDGAGGAIVTWHDNRSGNYDIYAQRVNASGALQWTANGVALCKATGQQSSPMIISDGAGGAIVTWTDRRSGTNYDIYAQSVNISGAVQWTANGVALCTAGGDQQNPTIDSDGAGGAIVTWTDYRNGSNNDVYAQRVNASGAVQWTANGVAVSATTGEQRYSTIASDGGGGAIITWHDSRSGSYHIYAQRVNASGAAQWTANGVAICTAAGVQNYPMIMSDGAGGAIIAWNDGRNMTDSDIYVQRVNASGAVQWTTDGVAISTATDYQQYPQMASDGAGGAIVTWNDLRNGNWDIYAGRIQASGTTDVPYAGIAVNALSQNYPNPFNPATLITFSVRASGEVKLRIYDAAGRALRTLVDGWRGAGEYRMMWDGKRDDGTTVASGVYFYRLKTTGLTATRKMVLLR